MFSTSIYFAEGEDFGVLKSDAPEVVEQVQALVRAGAEIVDQDGTAVQARVPLRLLETLFPNNKGLRKIAQSGGNGSVHISH